MSSPTQATDSSSTLDSTAVYLPPGQLYVAASPGAVTTVLGSCVAVYLFDPTLRAGGISHYLLPYWNGEGLASPKYANIALPILLEKLLKLGCRPQNLRAKLFGGGAVFQKAGGRFGIGERNIQFAELYLAESEIPVVARNVGERYTRKVIFHVHTGEALVRRIRSQESGRDYGS